ncbi:MAG: hypothetical protein MHM6MM_005324 [Cercozoa sp. M6MM]
MRSFAVARANCAVLSQARRHQAVVSFQCAPLGKQRCDAAEKSLDDCIREVFNVVRARDPNEVEFLQAVEEVVNSLRPLFAQRPDYLACVPTICEPERVVQFRVSWIDDAGHQQVNRGFRAQFSQTLGPYKGGLRYHPSVNMSIVKFLGFEQIFKNALTGLPIGAGEGGSDFDPKGKSDLEVMRFTQSFMTELYRHIGQDCDVPAGDIGVGQREIGYLYGQWKRITAQVTGVLTGKGSHWGGSLIRPEATGYGLVYISQYALQEVGQSMKGKRVLISGSGNVAQFAAQKVMQLGGKILTFSDSSGTLLEPAGFTHEQYDALVAIKQRRGRCRDYLQLPAGVKSPVAQYFDHQRPWTVASADVVMPCATQNEIDATDAAAILANGTQLVSEGANMPSTRGAIELFQAAPGVIFIPAKAGNAGGVAVSALEMAQNSARLPWSRERVDAELQHVMQRIFDDCKHTAARLGYDGDYQLGANAASFQTLCEAMRAQGQVYLCPATQSRYESLADNDNDADANGN